jgi:hypothetical protein
VIVEGNVVLQQVQIHRKPQRPKIKKKDFYCGAKDVESPKY